MIKHAICGAINWDTSIYVENHPLSGQEVRVNRILEIPGGKGGNTAVASSRILGRNKVAIIGAVGEDYLGQKQISEFQKEGVSTRLIRKIKGESSGQAFITIDSKGNNFIMTARNANQKLVIDFHFELLLKSFKNISVFTIIDPPLETAQKLISIGKLGNRLTIFMPALLTCSGIKKLKTLINDSNFVILNQSEAFSLTGTSDPVISCRLVTRNATDTLSIITLGEKGCIFGRNNKIWRIKGFDPSEIGLKILNTAGAGDAFAGAFSSLKAIGESSEEALILANLAGAICTTRHEIRGSPPIEYLSELRKKYNVRADRT